VADGAKVINLSVSGADYSNIMAVAVDRAVAAGVIVVASAGQLRADEVSANRAEYRYPASYPSVISVAAIRRDGSVLPTGIYNDRVDLSAPGTEVGIVAETGVEAYGSGSSFASPHVAAAAALLRRHRPDLTPAQVTATLIDTARDVLTTGSGWDPHTGAGGLDAGAAIAQGRAVPGPATGLAVTPSASATLADRPITATVAAWDAYGHAAANQAAAQVSYSLGTGCVFDVGTSPSVRTCRITARLGAAVDTAEVTVFDTSALRGLAITGEAAPGATLAVAAPDGWPAEAITWQWTYAGQAVAGAVGARHTVAGGTAPGTVVGVAWTLDYLGLRATGYLHAAAVVRSAATPTPSQSLDPAAKAKAKAKVKVSRKGRAVIVRVSAKGVARPAGTVTVKFGKIAKKAKLKAAGKGVVKVRAPARVKGKTKVKATFGGSKTVAKGTSVTKRMNFG
jgi:hypothetical protein